MEQNKPKQRRGFAAMSAEKQKSIASLGGKASHAAGKGHEWSKTEASVAGKKGGEVSQARRREKRAAAEKAA